MKSPETNARQVLTAALNLAQQKWGERLIAAYALGSLAHGAFSAVSDVDLGLIIEHPLLAADEQEVGGLVASIKATGKPFADRLSVFWGSVNSLSDASQGGRFPPLDRLDLIKYGHLLMGRDIRGGLPVPSRKDLVIMGAEFALRRLTTDEVLRKLKDPRSLAQSDAKTVTKLILYPVRFLFTARTGEVGRNEAAVEHYCAIGSARAAKLARAALEWRNAYPGSDTTTVEIIGAGVLSLYDEFLEDHEPRLDDYGRRDLARAFSQWRIRLRSR